MNNDEFEKQLERRPIRPVPGEWRAEILAAARAAAPAAAGVKGEEPKGWLEILLWPSPKAWAGLAAAWVVLLFVNATNNEKSPKLAQAASKPSPEMLQALREQRETLVKLIEPPETREAEPPKPYVPRPRGELKLEMIVV